MELVAFLGKDKETWGQITALINRQDWDKIILVKNKEADEFSSGKKCEIVDINSEKPMLELKEDIMGKLKGKLSDFEVALSLASGNGKEHMAMISALLSIPVGIRFTALTKEGLVFM